MAQFAKFLLVLSLVLMLANFVAANITCDTGSLDTTCVINSIKPVADGELINGTGNLVITFSGGLFNNTGGSFTVDMVGNVSIEVGGFLTTNARDLVGNINITANFLNISGSVTAQSTIAQTSGGNVNITVADFFLSGSIKTNVSTAQPVLANGGKGGDIKISSANNITITNTASVSADGGKSTSHGGGSCRNGNGGAIIFNSTNQELHGTITSREGKNLACIAGAPGQIELFVTNTPNISGAFFDPLPFVQEDKNCFCSEDLTCTITQFSCRLKGPHTFASLHTGSKVVIESKNNPLNLTIIGFLNMSMNSHINHIGTGSMNITANRSKLANINDASLISISTDSEISENIDGRVINIGKNLTTLGGSANSISLIVAKNFSVGSSVSTIFINIGSSLDVKPGASLSLDSETNFTLDNFKMAGIIFAPAHDLRIEVVNNDINISGTLTTNERTSPGDISIVTRTLNISGSINTRATIAQGNGGNINLTVSNFFLSGALNANVSDIQPVLANGGNGGAVIVKSAHDITITSGAAVNADGGKGLGSVCINGNAGPIVLDAINQKVHGTITSRAGNNTACNAGTSGPINVTFRRSLNVTGAVFIPNATFIFIPINVPPAFDFNLTDRNATVDEAFLLDVNCLDADNDTITYFDNTTKFDINPSTGLINFTPNTTEIMPLKITCSDGLDNSSQSFNINVKPKRFVIFGLNSVWLEQGSNVTGKVGARIASPGPVLDSNAEVTVGRSVRVSGKIFGDTVKLKSNSVVNGDVNFNELENNGQILGRQINPLNLPVEAQIPEFPTFAHGTINLTVNSQTIVSIQAGDYGDIKLLAGTIANPTVLRLEGGIFNISNLNLGDKTRVECLPIAPTTGCEIRIKNRLEPGSRAYIGPATNTTLKAKDIRIFVEGINGNTGNLGAIPKAATIGENNEITATIYVPNGTLWIKQSSTAGGLFIAKDVDIGIDVVVFEEE